MRTAEAASPWREGLRRRLAEQAARQALAEKGMDSDTKLRALTTLATALKKEGKDDYAKVAAAGRRPRGAMLYKEHSKEALAVPA